VGLIGRKKCEEDIKAENLNWEKRKIIGFLNFLHGLWISEA
jgi:hypothetical protein